MGNMDSKKSGTSMSRIENTNTVKPIPCDCRKCYNNIPYCRLYDLVRPHKRKCKRYSEQDYHVTKEEYDKSLETKRKRTEPVFPWERN